MTEKRGGNLNQSIRSPRETYAVWLRLDCLNSNPCWATQPRRYAGYRAAIATGQLIRRWRPLRSGTRGPSVMERLAMSQVKRMSGEPTPRYRATKINLRIAYGARALWQRSPNSSLSRGKPGTWRSGAGVSDVSQRRYA